MALARQVVGGGQAGRAGADHGHLLAAGRAGLDAGLPDAVVVVHGVALEHADGYGLVNSAAGAGAFAGMGADVGAHRGEGDALAHHRHRLAGVALADGADVAGGVHPRRTALAAGGLRRLPLAFGGCFNGDAAVGAVAGAGIAAGTLLLGPGQHRAALALRRRELLLRVLHRDRAAQQVFKRYRHAPGDAVTKVIGCHAIELPFLLMSVQCSDYCSVEIASSFPLAGSGSLLAMTSGENPSCPPFREREECPLTLVFVLFWSFDIRNFRFVSYFVIRISGLALPGSCGLAQDRSGSLLAMK